MKKELRGMPTENDMYIIKSNASVRQKLYGKQIGKNKKTFTRKIDCLKSERDYGLSSCSNFPEKSTPEQLHMDTPVLPVPPEVEHLREKIRTSSSKPLRAYSIVTRTFFSRHRADIRCCKVVEQQIEIEETCIPQREGAK